MSLRISELPAAGTLVGTELIELSKLSATITMTAATISADSTTNSFHDSAGGFLTAGFAVGQSIQTAGFTGSVANNKLARVITEVDATDMVFGGTDGDDIVTDAAGESVTLTAWVSTRATLTETVEGSATFAGATEGDLIMYDGTDWVQLAKGTEGQVLGVGHVAFGYTGNPQWLQQPAAPEAWGFACSDETTAITTGVKIAFVTPYSFWLQDVKASLTTPQTSGALFTVDIKLNGVSVFTTLLTFDNTEKGSFSATTPFVLADATTVLAGNTEVTIGVTQIGDGTAKGLKVFLVGGFTLGT